MRVGLRLEARRTEITAIYPMEEETQSKLDYSVLTKKSETCLSLMQVVVERLSGRGDDGDRS